MQTMINPGRLPGSLILRALLEVMLPAGSALAADGVIEINQARARAGGVSADDEPGFPVTPSRSGSYRKLQVNVQVPLEAPVGDYSPRQRRASQRPQWNQILQWHGTEQLDC